MTRPVLTMLNPLRMLRRRSDPAARVYARHPCCTTATLHLMERDYSVDGLLLEISRGGVLFREASRFTLDRHGADVQIRTPDYVWAGTIVNVRPEGYGIRFERLLSEDNVQEVLRLYGVNYSATG